MCQIDGLNVECCPGERDWGERIGSLAYSCFWREFEWKKKKRGKRGEFKFKISSNETLFLDSKDFHGLT